MPNFRLITDGSCLGNPGPGGYYFIAIDAKTSERIVYGGQGTPDTTNNKMELTAVLEGLRALTECLDRPKGIQVEVVSDSKYITDEINKKRASGEYHNRANGELWAELISIAETNSITLSSAWVKGHSGEPLNEECDGKARRLAEEARDNLNKTKTEKPLNRLPEALLVQTVSILEYTRKMEELYRSTAPLIINIIELIAKVNAGSIIVNDYMYISWDSKKKTALLMKKGYPTGEDLRCADTGKLIWLLSEITQQK